jgi:putative DNA primase/helicase
MTDLRSIARALGGEVSGRQVLAPGPGHSPRDRSLSVKLIGAPGGFVVHSHAGDDWQECRDYVRERLRLPAWQLGDDHREQRPPEDRRRTDDDVSRIKRAVELWNEGRSPFGTAAEDYLRSRALILTEEFAGRVLRLHPRCPWQDERCTQFIPCLIAAFRSIDDDAVTAIHRIRLDEPQRWPKTERKMFGPVRGAAVKLGAAGEKLTVGEGVETCMAAQQLGLAPAWALGPVGKIERFPVLDGVQVLTILGEPGEASAQAIQMCGRRWKQAGRRVLISRSSVGSDHNDFLMQQAVR